MPDDGDDLADSQFPDNPHPWRIPRPFGTGVKRKPIQFVPASAESPQETARDIQPNRGSSVADFYLSLVLPSEFAANPATPSDSGPSNQMRSTLKDEDLDVPCSSGVASNERTGNMMPSRRDHVTKSSLLSEGSSQISGSSDNLDTPEEARRDGSASCLSEDAAVQPDSAVVEQPIEALAAANDICPTCNSRVTDWKSHVRTTAHMFSLEHSKTPHHLNRQSEGYKHMVKLGWDPDSSRGLGAEGQGIRFPVKATAKKDNLGIGANPSKSIRDNADSVSDTNPKRQRLLTAKEMRRLEKAEQAARMDLHDYLRH